MKGCVCCPAFLKNERMVNFIYVLILRALSNGFYPFSAETMFFVCIYGLYLFGGREMRGGRDITNWCTVKGPSSISFSFSFSFSFSRVTM